jgi:2-polyprenyl-3-methyl-5-hydroxy-6-metoxy-1,4-benzoquinol methylase
MTVTTETPDVTTGAATDDVEAQVGAYAERLFMTGLDALEATTISLGRTLGLYDALGARDSSSPDDVAKAAGIHPRYAREWLEQQAVAGWIDVDDVDGSTDPGSRRYSLSIAARECLLNPDSLASVGPLFDLLPSIGTVLPAVESAFRTGGGVSYSDYAIHDAQANFNRPVFLNLLTTEWLPSIPGLADRLAADPAAKVAEIGCGEGLAAIAIANTWPTVEVYGYDLDEASIAAARKFAAEAGVADRVHFELLDVTAELSPEDQCHEMDFVFAFEMIHDLPRPVQALENMRHVGAPGATYLVVDENVAESFEAPSENPVERLLYACSVLHCLPVGMHDAPSVGTGTVMRPDTFRGYATAAGFDGVEVLPIEHDLFRFYRLITD